MRAARRSRPLQDPLESRPNYSIRIQPCKVQAGVFRSLWISRTIHQTSISGHYGFQACRACAAGRMPVLFLVACTLFLPGPRYRVVSNSVSPRLSWLSLLASFMWGVSSSTSHAYCCRVRFLVGKVLKRNGAGWRAGLSATRWRSCSSDEHRCTSRYKYTEHALL